MLDTLLVITMLGVIYGLCFYWVAVKYERRIREIQIQIMNLADEIHNLKKQ